MSAISQVGWDFQTFWWWSQVGPGEWEKSNSLSPLPPGCNFPQVDAFVYENCSHNVDTFSEFCTGWNWRPVKTQTAPPELVKTHANNSGKSCCYIFGTSGKGQRLNHPWNIVCRKLILSRTRGFLFCSGQISIRFVEVKADRTCVGAKFLTTYEMHYQMNGDSFSFIKGRCNIHI